ncbi:MAG: hypothetical protein H7Y19_13265 [Luteimonas sp.]|nr:hypothetical protein [Luteimonas sp.]
MKLLGIPLRTPNTGELTAAAVMGTGLWVAAVGMLRAAEIEIGPFDAGALLLVVLWGCVSARLGIRIGHGRRHLLANVLASAGLLVLYHVAWTLAG